MPSLNPFGEETKDRSGPVLRKSLEDLSQYRAASANLQIVVDVEQDNKLRARVHQGRADAVRRGGHRRRRGGLLAGSSKQAGAIKVSDDRKAVSITLPAATLTEARLDPARSRVFDRDRGLLRPREDVFADNPADEQPLYELAARKLSEAAKADPELRSGRRRTRSGCSRG